MLEQKFNFPVKDLILIYHLMPKSLCVAIKLWMVCVFEVVTILTIFKNFRSPEFHQWLVPDHSASRRSLLEGPFGLGIVILCTTQKAFPEFYALLNTLLPEYKPLNKN